MDNLFIYNSYYLCILLFCVTVILSALSGFLLYKLKKSKIARENAEKKLSFSQIRLTESGRDVHRYMQILNTLKINSWSWNIQKGEIINHKEYIIFNENMRDRFTFEDFLNIMDDEYKTDAITLKKRLINSETDKEHLLFSIKDSDKKQTIWIECHIILAASDKNGKPLIFTITSMNVTERIEIQENYKNAKERAEKADKLKSSFLANLSHEIRTPLNAIIGFSEILGTIDDYEEKREYIHIIHENNNILLHLIEDILDISKIDAGELDFSYSKESLDDIFVKVEEIVKDTANSGVVLRYERLSNDVIINTDKDRLSQVLSYLIANAVKFTKSGSIKFGYREKNSKFIYIYVTDTGCGIDINDHERIFKRFVKLDMFQMGTGLGLSICKSIVDKMGGEIGVISTLGVGSTFWFTIPSDKIDSLPFDDVPDTHAKRSSVHLQMPSVNFIA